MSKDIFILAIESSCDDTAAAVLKNQNVLSNIRANQLVHQKYGGVVPELASRAHQKNIVPVVDQAIVQARINKNQIHAVAYTRGPGLIGALLVGGSFAKSMSLALNVPLIEINHMQGHILAHFIDNETNTKPEFPFLCLTVSGGHTQIVQVNDYFEMDLLGETLDDAAGEAFDKIGKLLGLDYPAGHLIDKLAKEGNPKAFKFSQAKVDKYAFSFSGLKTQVLNFLRKEVEKNPSFIKDNLNDLAASVQYTIVESLMTKIRLAMAIENINQIAIAGGVSANSGLRNQLLKEAKENKWQVFLPPFEYTVDNAAMIGIAAYHKYLKQDFADLDTVSVSRYSI